MILLRLINKMIYINDSIKFKNYYAKIICKDKVDFIDLNARNTFPSRVNTILIIKCTYGFNHYARRDYIINK